MFSPYIRVVSPRLYFIYLFIYFLSSRFYFGMFSWCLHEACNVGFVSLNKQLFQFP